MKSPFNIYVVSDTHINHWNIIEFTKRPFLCLGDMNKKIVANWNRVVRPQDLVIVLGDFIWTAGESDKIKHSIKQFNGRIILVKGNHDRKSHSWYLANGVQFICDRFVWEYNKKRILFVHDPAHVRPEEIQIYDYIVHGHQHGNTPFVRRIEGKPFINVSVENLKYTPINLITILSRMVQGYYDTKNTL